MKRVFALISVLSILACLMLPVSASSGGWYNDFTNSVFNVLDYATPNDSLDNSISVNNGDSVTFNIANYMRFSYVDILFYISGSDIISVDLNGNNLSYINYDNGLRRLYGHIPDVVYNEFILNFTTYGTSRIDFLKFDAISYEQDPVSTLGRFHYEINGNTYGDRIQSFPNEDVSIYQAPIAYPNSGTDFIDHKYWLQVDDWTKYDYLTFLFYTDLNITSIVANGENGSFPLTSSVFQLGSDLGTITDKVIQVTVDISSYDKASEVPPAIQIRADQKKDHGGLFALYSVYGSFDFSYPDPELSFLRKFMFNVGNWFSDVNSNIDTFMDNVGEWFEDLIASITGVFEFDTQESEEDKAALENQSSQIDDLNSQMEDVVYPDINSNDIMINEVYPNDVSYSVQPFNAVFNNQILFSIFTMSLTLALASYVLYGKR